MTITQKRTWGSRVFYCPASEPHALGGCCVVPPSSASIWSRPSASGRRAGAAREQRSDGGGGSGGGCDSGRLRRLCGSWWRRWLAWTRAEAAGPPLQPQHRGPGRWAGGGGSPRPPSVASLLAVAGKWPRPARELSGRQPGAETVGKQVGGERLCVVGKGTFPFCHLIFLSPKPPPTWGSSPGGKKPEER